MEALRQYFRNVQVAVSTVLTGMAITARHIGRKETTVQYPEQRDVLPPRSRMSLFMNADECIACNQCARACPVDCIHIESVKREKGEAVPVTIVEEKKKAIKLTMFEIDMSQCCYCALCVDPCPTHCLYMTPEFEFSVTNMVADEMDVQREGEEWVDADHRKIRTRKQVQHPKFGRTGLLYDFIAMTADLHARGEHVPENPLYVEEYRKILDGPVPIPGADDPYTNRPDRKPADVPAERPERPAAAAGDGTERPKPAPRPRPAPKAEAGGETAAADAKPAEEKPVEPAAAGERPAGPEGA